MRQAWIIALLAALAATGAFAQSAQEGGPPPVEFARGPDARDYARFYPRAAWEQGIGGRVVLCCLVTPDGELACADVGENPTGQGFGQAARRVAIAFRLTPQSTSAWLAYGGPIRLPIAFRAPDGDPAPDIQPEPRCGQQAESMDHATPIDRGLAYARQNASATSQ